MDYPFDPELSDNDFIAFVPGMMPDLLTDLDSQNGYIRNSDEMSVIWVNAEIPHDAKPGKYFVTISFETENERTDSTMEVEIADVAIPKQELIFNGFIRTALLMFIAFPCTAKSTGSLLISILLWRHILE